MINRGSPSPEAERKLSNTHRLLAEKQASLPHFGRNLLSIFADRGFTITPAITFRYAADRKPVVLGTTPPELRNDYNLFCNRVGGIPWREAYAQAFPQSEVNQLRGENRLNHEEAIQFVDGLFRDPSQHVIFYITPEIFERSTRRRESVAQSEMLHLLKLIREEEQSGKNLTLHHRISFAIGY